jgi:hypothetical protein
LEEFIVHVEVSLEYPERMSGIARIESVISYDSEGEIIKNYQELVNSEINFADGHDITHEVIEFVASETEVSKGDIEIIE